MHMKQDLQPTDILAALRRDPESWRGISLLYLRMPPKALPLSAVLEYLRGDRPDMLIFHNYDGEYLVLGGPPLPEALEETPELQVWLDDIAGQWPTLHNILDEAPATVAAPASFASSSILVVEDDPMTSQIASKHLKPFGSVIAGSNSQKAVANYMVHRPDIVFLDIHYRDDKRDGFDVLNDLLSADASAFIVMVSSDRNAATILEALTCGAQGFIAKPFRPVDFAHYLAKFSKRRAA